MKSVLIIVDGVCNLENSVLFINLQDIPEVSSVAPKPGILTLEDRVNLFDALSETLLA